MYKCSGETGYPLAQFSDGGMQPEADGPSRNTRPFCDFSARESQDESHMNEVAVFLRYMLHDLGHGRRHAMMIARSRFPSCDIARLLLHEFKPRAEEYRFSLPCTRLVDEQISHGPIEPCPSLRRRKGPELAEVFHGTNERILEQVVCLVFVSGQISSMCRQ